MSNLSDVEKIVYEVIKRETENSGGIMQRKLKEIQELKNIRPRELQHIVKKLIKMNLVRRLRVSSNGKTSYFLQAVLKELTKGELIKISLDDIINIPCLTCKYIAICGTSKLHNPSRCSVLTRYLISKTLKSPSSSYNV